MTKNTRFKEFRKLLVLSGVSGETVMDKMGKLSNPMKNMSRKFKKSTPENQKSAIHLLRKAIEGNLKRRSEDNELLENS